MKKILLMSTLLMFGLSAEEVMQERQCHCQEACCEDECICGDHCECSERPQYQRRRRNYYDYPDQADHATWPGKMEDSFMEQMTR